MIRLRDEGRHGTREDISVGWGKAGRPKDVSFLRPPTPPSLFVHTMTLLRGDTSMTSTTPLVADIVPLTQLVTTTVCLWGVPPLTLSADVI